MWRDTSQLYVELLQHIAFDRQSPGAQFIDEAALLDVWRGQQSKNCLGGQLLRDTLDRTFFCIVITMAGQPVIFTWYRGESSRNTMRPAAITKPTSISARPYSLGCGLPLSTSRPMSQITDSAR